MNAGLLWLKKPLWKANGVGEFCRAAVLGKAITAWAKAITNLSMSLFGMFTSTTSAAASSCGVRGARRPVCWTSHRIAHRRCARTSCPSPASYARRGGRSQGPQVFPAQLRWGAASNASEGMCWTGRWCARSSRTTRWLCLRPHGALEPWKGWTGAQSKAGPQTSHVASYPGKQIVPVLRKFGSSWARLQLC